MNKGYFTGRRLSIISGFLATSLSTALLSSWATKHALSGGTRLPRSLAEVFLFFAKVPTQTKGVVDMLSNILPPDGLTNIYHDYCPSNHNNRTSGYLLVSKINKDGLNIVSLINISNNRETTILTNSPSLKSAKYTDSLVGSDDYRQSLFSSRNRIWSPYLSKDGTITYLTHWNDLVAYDALSCSEKWRVRGAFHHSLEPDSEGNLWACAAIKPGSFRKNSDNFVHSNVNFEDQALVKISASGKIMQVISVADIIINSRIEHLIYGMSNPNYILDPIHLNQITPIRTDSGEFKRGYLLVSLRNLSTIVLIDPKRELVVWHQSGPWLNQHCVMLLGRSEFSVLDNHSFASGQYWINQDWNTRILKFNLEFGTTDVIQFNLKNPRDFRIPIEGRALPIKDNGWVLEDCQRGTIFLFKKGELIFKWSNLYPDGSVGITSWCRYLEDNQVPEKLVD